MEFDDVLPLIGQFGRYQKLVYYLLCIPASWPAVFLTFNHVFMSATPEHWCAVPELAKTNLTLQQKLNLSIPRQIRDGISVFSRCLFYSRNWTNVVDNELANGQWVVPNSSWPTEKCKHGWEYDDTNYDNTLVTQLNLVCDDKRWPSMATTAFYVGSLFGNVLFGRVADQWGRKLSFFVILGVQLVFAIFCAFSTDIITYTVFRTFQGLTFPAIFQVPFIIGIELMGPEYRTFAGMVVCIFFASSMCLLAVIAHLCRDWFKLALITSVPCVLLFGLCWIIPESPRWLLSKRKFSEAELIVQKIAKSNGKRIPKDLLLSILKEKGENTKFTESPGYTWDLFRTPNMRKKTLIITLNWLSNAVVYNGLSYMSSNMGINDFVAFFISGLVEIPSYLITWFAMQRWGRRCSLITTQLIGGIACVCTIFVPHDQVWVTLALSMIGKFGISGSFAVIYVFGGELYPTVVRALGLAISSFVAGIGLIISPSIVYLAVYSRILPLIIMGILSVAGAIAVVWLPETLGCHLPQTMAEGEAFGKNGSSLPSVFLRRREKRDKSNKLNLIKSANLNGPTVNEEKM